MNKGKQWKWSKKVRQELEKQGKSALKINKIHLASSTNDENSEKYIMPVKKVSKKEASRIYPKRPRKFRGICLNWPKEVKRDVSLKGAIFSEYSTGFGDNSFYTAFKKEVRK